MFREPSRHEQGSPQTAGADAGDVGGCLSDHPDSSIDRLHLWALQGGCADRVEWWARRV
jgi:hypothetical protein